MAIQAYSSVSVVDLVDVGYLNLYLTSNLPNSVIYDPNQTTGNAYSPNWASTNLRITPVITYNGKNLPLNSTGLTVSYERQEGISAFTALTSGETVTGGILTVNQNKPSTVSGNQLTYICTITYSNPSIGQPITSKASLTYSIISMAQEAKSASITGGNAFLYDTDKEIVGNTSITLTAETIHCSVSQWQYETAQGTFAPFPTTNNASITGETLVVRHDELGIWLSNRTAVIKLVTDETGIYDLMQINKIYDGAPGDSTVTAILTNENHVLSANSDGTIRSWNGASTQLIIYEGGVDTTSDWTVTVTNGTGLTGTYDTTTHVYTPTALTEDNSYAEFTATKTGYSTVRKRYSISRQYAGVDGADAVIYEVVPSNYAINQNEDGTFVPTSVTFNAYQKQGAVLVKSAYSGRFVISESTDGSNFTSKYTSTQNESSKTYTPSSETVVAIRCFLYASGGTTSKLDEQTVVVARDGNTGASGADGLSMGLGNYSDVIPCNTSGNASPAREINIPFYCYKGITRTAVTATVGTLPTGVTLKTNTAGTASKDGTIILSVANGATFGNSATMTGDITITLTADSKSGNFTYTWTKNKQASSAVILQLYSEDGGTVEVGRSTTIKTQMYQGTTVVTPTAVAWAEFKNGSYQTISGQTGTSIVISDSMVTDQMWLRCTATYGGKNYVAYYTIDDVTDELMAYTFSTVAEFKNNVGQGAIYTRVYRGGQEVDPIKSVMFSTSAPPNPTLGDFYYHLDTTAKACVLKKYDGTDWINAPASDNDAFTYSYYRIDSTGKTLDTSNPWKTGRCQYVDPSIVNSRMQFVCEISEV